MSKKSINFNTKEPESSDLEDSIKKQLRKLQRYVGRNNLSKVEEWIENADLPQFHVKLSNCHVLDYQTDTFRSPVGTINIPLDDINKYSFPQNLQVYWLDTQGVLNICRKWLNDRDVTFQAILLLILPTSVSTKGLEVFLQTQLKYFPNN